MKRILMAALTVLCILQAQFFAHAGTFVDNVFQGSVRPEVTSLFARFPNGGDALVVAIAEALLRDPTWADDIAQTAKLSNNNAIKQAAGEGMGIAIFVLTEACSKGPCSDARKAGPGAIASAARQATDPLILAEVSKASGGLVTIAGQYIPSAAIFTLVRSVLSELGLCTGSPC